MSKLIRTSAGKRQRTSDGLLQRVAVVPVYCELAFSGCDPAATLLLTISGWQLCAGYCIGSGGLGVVLHDWVINPNGVWILSPAPDGIAACRWAYETGPACGANPAIKFVVASVFDWPDVFPMTLSALACATRTRYQLPDCTLFLDSGVQGIGTGGMTLQTTGGLCSVAPIVRGGSCSTNGPFSAGGTFIVERGP